MSECENYKALLLLCLLITKDLQFNSCETNNLKTLVELIGTTPNLL